MTNKRLKYYEVVLKDGRVFGKIKSEIGKKLLEYMSLPKDKRPAFVRINKDTGFDTNMISSINLDRENWQYE